MAYPKASAEQIAFFREHGWIAVEDAFEPADIRKVEEFCYEIVRNKDTMAYDWAWEKGASKEGRQFKILQSSPTRFWPELNHSVFRLWAIEFASSLLGKQVEFWYDQFLAKPPGNSAPTYWHQDEAYWGRNLDESGITCWMPFHDVDASNGCMHFIDGGHKDGILEHRQPGHVQSDLLLCDVDEKRCIVAPLKFGSVTFHHGKTPHMTTANVSDAWRRVLTQHLKAVGVEGEGGHYPWKVRVNQFTGERSVPAAP